MTITATPNRVSFAGNGVTTAFPAGFKYFDTADLEVILRTVMTGVEVVQTAGVDYNFTGNPENGSGGVAMTVAPAAGTVLTLVDVPSITQELALVDNQDMPADSFNTSLDILATYARRAKDVGERSVQLSEGYNAAFDTHLPALLPANAILVVNPTGDGFAAGPAVADIAAAEAAIAISVAAAAASAGAAGASAGAANASAVAAAASAATAAAAVAGIGASVAAAAASAAAALASENTSAANAVDANASAVAAAASAASAAAAAAGVAADAAAAAASAVTATTAATAAGVSQVAAAASATAAAISETNAGNSATAANASATASAASATAAAASEAMAAADALAAAAAVANAQAYITVLENVFPSGGARDGVNLIFTMPHVPIVGSAVIAMVDGVAREKFAAAGTANVTISAGLAAELAAPSAEELKFVYLRASNGATIIAGGNAPFYYTLTAPDIAAKFFTLPYIPSDPTMIVLDAPLGAPQTPSSAGPGNDYAVIGNTIDWNGLALDGELSVGDKVRVLDTVSYQGITGATGPSGLAALSRRATAVSGPFLTTDEILAITDTSAVRTITMPPAASVPAGQIAVITDESGQAQVNNVKILAAAGDTLDQFTEMDLTDDYGNITFYSNGINLWKSMNL